jgi:hypothetical protein
VVCIINLADQYSEINVLNTLMHHKKAETKNRSWPAVFPGDQIYTFKIAIKAL